MDYERFLKPIEELSDCIICPRNCHTNRIRSSNGYCRSDASFRISSICVHKGEEPVIGGEKGICNIFFSHCNLQCIYCQNHQISSNCRDHMPLMKPDEILGRIFQILDKGISRVGFVTPSHFVPHVKAIIAMVESTGRKPVWIYNTNSYDKKETLRSLEGIIDVYLPDMKYRDPDLAKEFSDAPRYPEVAAEALKEMYRQKGSAFLTDDDGLAVSGIIVRHLVLPGKIENSKKVLDFIAGELSPKIHFSLMSQYYPVKEVSKHPYLNRKITADEYTEVIRHMENLGMYNGWIQEIDSTDHYRPDFNRDHPFE